MPTTANIPLVPSDISLDILEALKMALAKVPRTRTHGELRRDYLDHVKQGFVSVKPGLGRVKTALPYRIRQKVYYEDNTDYELLSDRRRRVKRELLDAGITPYGLLKSESRYVPSILHPNERVEAVIYGQHQSSSAMMLATDERIIYLDKKPMVMMFDEVSYEVVSGIEFDIHTFFATVVLHTPVKNYAFRYVNLHCAEKFVRLIESQRLEREKEASKSNQLSDTSQVFVQNPEALNKLNKDMAGYYWLPIEEEEADELQKVSA